ncbi:MAG: thiamine-phosphate kinase [Cyanobacteriota bacterium]|jgi:thiamine-monophosphate kinase
MGEGPTLADLGEWELIRRLGAFAPPGQFNDDAALIPAAATEGMGARGASSSPEAGSLVVNTDLLVEGLHFSDATTEAADVGWRAAMANLSDLAAMGCTQVVGLTVGLVAPPSTPWSWVEGVYGGLVEALNTWDGVLLGGDCSGGTQRLLAITAIGRLGPTAGGEARAPSGAIRRGDGRPGDWLVSSGPHGLSRLGLDLLQDPEGTLAARVDGPLRQRAIQAHRRPRARLDAVKALIASRPAAVTWRVGGCDSSDGLAAAVEAVATASGCGARLERTALPLDSAMAALAEAEAWCLGGGEDFELVLALEPAWALALVATLPGSGVIGGLVAAPRGEVRWSAPGEGASAWSESTPGGDRIVVSGYRHFG